MSVEETSVDFCQVKIKSCTNAENWRKLVEFFLFGNDPFGPVSVEETSGSFEFRFLS